MVSDLCLSKHLPGTISKGNGISSMLIINLSSNSSLISWIQWIELTLIAVSDVQLNKTLKVTEFKMNY